MRLLRWELYRINAAAAIERGNTKLAEHYLLQSVQCVESSRYAGGYLLEALVALTELYASVGKEDARERAVEKIMGNSTAARLAQVSSRPTLEAIADLASERGDF